jgi:hypothetical protein
MLRVYYYPLVHRDHVLINDYSHEVVAVVVVAAAADIVKEEGG